MAINLGNENEEEIMAEINMTPLIDIMLVLLILFMVTSSVTLESGLDIDLPKTSSQQTAKGPEAIIVSMDNKGNLSVQGSKTTFETLQNDIAAALKTAKSSLVIFEGDQKATLGRAIEVMDIAKQAGAEKFAIATEGK